MQNFSGGGVKRFVFSERFLEIVANGFCGLVSFGVDFVISRR